MKSEMIPLIVKNNIAKTSNKTIQSDLLIEILRQITPINGV